MVFDLLYRDGRDLRARPLVQRRARLEDVVPGNELVFPVRRLAADGEEAWKQVVERGYEGYVAKDEASTYEAGRTRRWLKVKQRAWTIGDDRWTRRISVSRPHVEQKTRRPRGCGANGLHASKNGISDR
jgi:ATP-dependent DNA ligase